MLQIYSRAVVTTVIRVNAAETVEYSRQYCEDNRGSVVLTYHENRKYKCLFNIQSITPPFTPL